MTTYPPELPAADWTNETPNRDRHPGDHNALLVAIAALVEHAATKDETYSRADADDRYVRTVNAQAPDADGNVVLALPSPGGVGTITKVNGQVGPEVSLNADDVGAASGDDPRLADQRVPLPGSVDSSKVVTGGLPPAAITGTAVVTADSRLSDTRVPKVHAASHAAGGSDPVTPAAIGAMTQAGGDARYVRTVGGVAPDGSGNVPGGGAAATVAWVAKSGSSWPARPTSSAAVMVIWLGAAPGPATVTSGTGGMLVGSDFYVQPS